MENAWEEVRKRLNPESGFKPFWIVMKDGTVYPVVRRFQASVSPDGSRGFTFDVDESKAAGYFFGMEDVAEVRDAPPLVHEKALG